LKIESSVDKKSITVRPGLQNAPKFRHLQHINIPTTTINDQIKRS